MIKFNRAHLCNLLLLSLLIAVMLSNYIWLEMDKYPVEGHELAGLLPAAIFYRKLTGGLYEPYKAGLAAFDSAYPPLSYLIVVLFYFLFGLQGQMVVMVNSIYIIVTLTCVYLIGRHIFNKRIGLLSAFILSSFPGFISYSRFYWIEFGLMAYVSLALYFLLKTNLFESRRYSILLGISLGLSLLHKPEFIAFIIGPFLLVAYRSEALKDILKMRWTKAMTNVILVLTIGLALSSLWWAHSFKRTFEHHFSSIFSLDNLHGEGNILSSYFKDILSYDGLVYYLSESIIFLIGGIFLILFFSAAVFIIIKIIIKDKKRFYMKFLILSFVVPYIIFSACGIKNTPHILAILPFVAILIAAGVYFLENKIIKIILISWIVLYCLALHLYPFFNIQILNDFYHFTFRFKPSSPRWFLDTYNLPRGEQLELGIKEILEFIDIDSIGGKNLKCFVGYKSREFSGSIFQYYSLIENHPIRFFNPNWDGIDWIESSQFDYIIIEKPERESMEETLSRKYSFSSLLTMAYDQVCRKGLEDLDLVKIYKIPNGDTSALIYRKKRPSFYNR